MKVNIKDKREIANEKLSNDVKGEYLLLSC